MAMQNNFVDAQRPSYREILIVPAKKTFNNFKRANSPATLTSIAIKTLVILVGIYLTVSMSLELYRQYRDEPVVTVMQMKTVNNSLELPNAPILCLSTEPFASSVDLNWFAIFDAELTSENTENLVTSADFHTFPSNVVEGTDPWPLFLLKAVHLYFTKRDVTLVYCRNVSPEYGYADDLVLGILQQGINETGLRERILQEYDRISGSFNPEWIRSYLPPMNTTAKDLLSLPDGEIIFQWKGWKYSWFMTVYICLTTATATETGGDGASGVDCSALEERLQHMNITMDQLRQAFGLQVALLYSFQIGINTDDPECPVSYTNISHILSMFERTTYVGQAEICYRVNVTTFNTVNTITFSHPTVWAFPILPDFPPLNSARLTIAIDFGGFERDRCAYTEMSKVLAVTKERELFSAQLAVDSAVASLLTMDNSQTNTVIISLASTLHYLKEVVKGVPHCSDYPTIYHCFRGCRVQLLNNALNCTPTSLIALTDFVATMGKNECTIAAQSQWNRRPAMEQTKAAHCIKSCLRPCLEWRFALERRSSDIRNLRDYLIVQFVHVSSMFTYPAYEEQYTLTLANSIGNFGGVLGLWLGIDLLIVTELALIPLTFIVTFIDQKCCGASGGSFAGKRTDAATSPLESNDANQDRIADLLARIQRLEQSASAQLLEVSTKLEEIFLTGLRFEGEMKNMNQKIVQLEAGKSKHRSKTTNHLK